MHSQASASPGSRSEMKLIPLTRGMFAKVDDADFDFLSQFYWYANSSRGKFTARGNVNGKEVYMHRLLMDFPKETVDHRNLDELDNQRSNLRVATHSQNNANRRTAHHSASGYKGVSLQRSNGCPSRPWLVSVQVNHDRYYCGCYQTPEEAATAYGLYALAAHGEFARF